MRDLIETGLPQVVRTEEEIEHHRTVPGAIEVFRPETPTPEVLRGKWDLSKAHLQELAERFNVSREDAFADV